MRVRRLVCVHRVYVYHTQHYHTGLVFLPVVQSITHNINHTGLVFLPVVLSILGGRAFPVEGETENDETESDEEVNETEKHNKGDTEETIQHTEQPINDKGGSMNSDATDTADTTQTALPNSDNNTVVSTPLAMNETETLDTSHTSTNTDTTDIQPTTTTTPTTTTPTQPSTTPPRPSPLFPEQQTVTSTA